MELRQLEHFTTVADERHFTRAAEALQISQSGLSASIRSLENELGTSLFVRSTRRVELTAAGHAFLGEARRTLASVAEARAAVDAVRGVITGRLSVGAEPCVGSVDLPAQLARFRVSHPGVDIRLRHGGSVDMIESVAAGHTDAALVVDAGDIPAGVVLHELSSQPLVVLCEPGHRFAAAAEVTLDDLRRETLVGFQDGWGVTALARRAFSAAGLEYRAHLEVNDVHPLLELVGYGLGVAIAPESFGRKRPDRLRAIPLVGAPRWVAAIAAAPDPSPAATAFLAQIAAASDRRADAGSGAIV